MYGHAVSILFVSRNARVVILAINVSTTTLKAQRKGRHGELGASWQRGILRHRRNVGKHQPDPHAWLLRQE